MQNVIPIMMCVRLLASFIPRLKCIEFETNALIFKLLSPWNVHGTEQTQLTRVFQSGTHFTDVSTEAMWMMCIAHGHNILTQPGCDMSFAGSRRRHLAHMTNMFQTLKTYLFGYL